MRALFLSAIAVVAPIFIVQLKNQIQVWAEDYRIRQRKEKLERERDSR